ncbi:MAG: RES domain-containing protein, partial [Proteobacteria bacterium]|nr:RES domain-containing protein [Pseudomonadota bacterium]
MVELQASSSTRVLVANSQAHDRLEEILDGGKPIIQLLTNEKECAKLHYLLLTPFRYPPLRFGSRFSTIFDRGLFYASTAVTTAATEKAFYRIFLAKGTKGKVGNKNIYYTAFESKIMTHLGADLTKQPFSNFQDK